MIIEAVQWIIKQDYKNKYLVTGDWSQPMWLPYPNHEVPGSRRNSAHEFSASLHRMFRRASQYYNSIVSI